MSKWNHGSVRTKSRRVKHSTPVIYNRVSQPNAKMTELAPLTRSVKANVSATVDIYIRVSPAHWSLTIDAGGGNVQKFSSDYKGRTSFKMALLCTLAALLKLGDRGRSVVIHSDVEYIEKGIAVWLPRWKRMGYMHFEDGVLTPIQYADLWRRIDRELTKHKVTSLPLRSASPLSDVSRQPHSDTRACTREVVV
jgi:hypothetical protein